MTIVKSDHWRDALRNTTPMPQDKSKQTTPMRKLIKKMPGLLYRHVCAWSSSGIHDGSNALL